MIFPTNTHVFVVLALISVLCVGAVIIGVVLGVFYWPKYVLLILLAFFASH